MKRRGVRSAQLQITNCKSQIPQGGYILITLMLFITLIAILALAVLPEITFQIKRDREEEMIHRGVEYRRAVQKYYKKFKRYPARIEELENTNNLRFLRKRYTDPITGKDFKLLRFGDPKLMGFMGMGGQGGLVGTPAGGIRPGAVNPNMPQVTGLPQPSNTGTPNALSGDSSNPSNAQTNPNSSASSSSSSSSSNVFGGGPILGVACDSDAITIREFNDKNHYNDWLFIYDPTTDRGGLLIGPAQMSFGQGISGRVISGPGQMQRPPNPGQGQPAQPPGPNPNPQPMPPDQ
jgi:type II secretory pathway pseudopilin PulG